MGANNHHVQTRADAAASIKWPARTPFLVNPDPNIRKRLSRGFLCLCALLLACLFITDANGPVGSWIKFQESNELRPTMESSFAHGNKEAGTWLWEHYTKDYPGLLRQEADASEPRAMYLMGWILLNDGRFARRNGIGRGLTEQQKHDKGLSLIKSAAVAGNLDATVYLAKPHKT